MWINYIWPIIANDSGNKYATPTRKSYLDTLVLNKVIKPSSRDWLTGALDPFHDFQFTPEGLPDQFAGSTVVQFIKRKITINAPTTLVAGDKWDAHIFISPTMVSRAFQGCTSSPGTLNSDGAYTHQLGTVSVVKVKSGTPTLPNTIPFPPPAVFQAQVLSPCDNGNDFSLMRVIGGGFEIHNDTAELYKNGSVVVYAQPTQRDIDYGVANFVGSPQHQGNWYRTRSPPATVSDATSNINSVTWSAAEGCYVPFLLDMEDMDFRQATAIPMVMNKVDSSLDYAFTPAITNSLAATGDDSNIKASEPMRYAGLETTGAYFTGLSFESILTLDVRFIVEIAPTPANTTLISLATPSSEYDPEALVLYSRACRELPAGVKVSMNAGGDWWKIVSGAINYAAPIVAKMGPYGAAISAGAQGIRVIGDTVQKAREGRRGTQNPRAAPAPPLAQKRSLNLANQSTKDLRVTSNQSRGKDPSSGNWKKLAKK